MRAPSAFSITLVVLPSMMATHELVVPRSMPMILPIFFSFASQPPKAAVSFPKYDVEQLWISRWISSAPHVSYLGAVTVTRAGRNTLSAMR